jgi:hypothetical protein
MSYDTAPHSEPITGLGNISCSDVSSEEVDSDSDDESEDSSIDVSLSDEMCNLSSSGLDVDQINIPQKLCKINMPSIKEVHHQSILKSNISCPGCQFETKSEASQSNCEIEVNMMSRRLSDAMYTDLKTAININEPILDWEAVEILELSSIEADDFPSEPVTYETNSVNHDVLGALHDVTDPSVRLRLSSDDLSQSVSQMESFIDACLTGSSFTGFDVSPSVAERIAALHGVQIRCNESAHSNSYSDNDGETPNIAQTRSRGPVRDFANVQTKILERRSHKNKSSSN